MVTGGKLLISDGAKMIGLTFTREVMGQVDFCPVLQFCRYRSAHLRPCRELYFTDLFRCGGQGASLDFYLIQS